MKKFLRIFLVFAAILAAGVLAGLIALKIPTDHDKRLAQVERLAQRGVARGYWPGIMWAEVAPGRIISSGAAGFADIETARPMTPQTTMPIGSISKIIVGLAAAQAIHDGVLDPDAPLSNYLSVPFDAPDGMARTFSQLATHTSGIRDTDAGYEDAGYHFGAYQHPVALPDFLASYLGEGGALFDPQANFGPWKPGTRFEYSNIGAGLAAQAIADATGEDFAAYSTANVVVALGLTGFWGNVTPPGANAVTLYETEETTGGFQALPPYGLATWPDGQFNASARDLARLLATVMGEGTFENRQVIAPQVIALLTESRAQGVEGMDSPDDKFGLFWTQETLHFGPLALRLKGHNGGDPGVLTLMYALPGTDHGFVVMMNGEALDTLGVLHLVRLIYLLAEPA